MKYLNKFKNIVLMFLVLFVGTSTAQNLDTLFTSEWITSIELVNKNPGVILISGPGVLRSNNFGTTWDSASFNSEPWGCYDISMNQINTDKGYLASDNGLFATTNGGLFWSKVNLNGSFYLVDINPLFPNFILAQESEDPFLGTWILYKSTNSGNSWYTVNIPRFIVDLQFHPSDSMIAYGWSGPHFQDIYKTTDQGNTWFSILHESSTSQFYSLSVHKNQPGILYASSEGKIYKTTDDGQNWTEIGAGLRAVLGNSYWIHNFVFDETTPGRFYVGLGSGLFLTENDGETWRRIHHRDITQVVGDNEKPMHLYFITNYERTLIRMLDTFTVTGINTPVNMEPKDYLLEQNYPNPFNPTTTIKYSLEKNSYVQLKVYDILGREVKTLINSYQSAGEHSMKFSGKGLASGVYFYSLSTEEFSQTKKMILLP